MLDALVEAQAAKLLYMFTYDVTWVAVRSLVNTLFLLGDVIFYAAIEIGRVEVDWPAPLVVF